MGSVSRDTSFPTLAVLISVPRLSASALAPCLQSRGGQCGHGDLAVDGAAGTPVHPSRWQGSVCSCSAEREKQASKQSAIMPFFITEKPCLCLCS